jgi:hypothetical protein
MNARLREVYRDALDKLRTSWSPAEGDSQPMLIEVPESYAIASVRLLVVGQEAGGWGEKTPTSDDPVNALMSLYREFALGRTQRSTPFWQGARHVFEMIARPDERDAFLWSNLVKVDVRRKRPPVEVEELVARLKLLEAEVEITKPDAVLFLSGPSYDNRIRAAFPSATIDELSNGSATISGLSFKAFRTYHPKYLRLSRKWSELDRAAEHFQGSSNGLVT